MQNKSKIEALNFALLLCLLCAGCATGTSSKVYYNMNNWYVRQNAVPRYSAKYDVFYLHPKAFEGDALSIEDQDYVVHNTVEKFGKEVRIFAPVCRDARECKASFKWYFDQYHGNSDRPFVFIGEGDGARMLEPLVKKARKKGLVSVKFRFEESEEVFVTPELVEELNEEVKKYLFDLNWREQRFVE